MLCFVLFLSFFLAYTLFLLYYRNQGQDQEYGGLLVFPDLISVIADPMVGGKGAVECNDKSGYGKQKIGKLSSPKVGQPEGNLHSWKKYLITTRC